MISGAGRGIGAAIAQRLAQQGWRISAGLRDPDAFTLPSPHMACHFDATDCESEQHWVARTLARHGRIDAVVANAGIMIPGSLLEVDDAGLERMLQVNVRSPARLGMGGLARIAGDRAGPGDHLVFPVGQACEITTLRHLCH
ncbi:SDR family oxidoreductase [Komagataeibacter rhaeticus]|nr:SDR family oxidoreductase [Komagataeibacter rhaeticus]